MTNDFEKLIGINDLVFGIIFKIYHYIHLGGNLGLFTGMSVLSLFEIIFWVARFIFRGRKVDGKPLNKNTGRKLKKKLQKRKSLGKTNRYSR